MQQEPLLTIAADQHQPAAQLVPEDVGMQLAGGDRRDRVGGAVRRPGAEGRAAGDRPARQDPGHLEPQVVVSRRARWCSMITWQYYASSF
ncbi:hypothetical protein MXD62_19040 [Frankia sp. Mgl5]|uniref:hypothetical protein n=1 Tax=Frankia sp. Mgl5 TaxID=2933793 RepID=UPI00200EC072|nr:hypothetical protein [Frankia sp. Mgl5]MCK9929247.1 hypothetical protein [Frankia sp. Mgl5]